MCGDVMTCAGTCSQAQSHEPPQKLEELRQLKRGFPGFLLSTKVKKNHRIQEKTSLVFQFQFQFSKNEKMNFIIILYYIII